MLDKPTLIMPTEEAIRAASLEKELYDSYMEILQSRKRIAELEKHLEEINSIMWQSWGVKGAIFGHAQGEQIMKVLEKWSEK